MKNSKSAATSSESVDQLIREAYETEGVYNKETICHRLDTESREYVDCLLADKLQTVQRNMSNGLLVDLCCATGEHLFSLAEKSSKCLGIDFSRPYIEKAKERAADLGLKHVEFEVGDAKNIPLATGSVGTLYSFSALYAIPGVDEVMKEIARVLRVGGRCVLDLGNSSSLNAICVRAYTELPPVFYIPVREMIRLCELHDLEVVEKRSFQLLPLWADKPRWLWPLLHPFWKRIMAKRIGGKMIDEWVSGNRLLRRYAFRHVLVCEKRQEKVAP